MDGVRAVSNTALECIYGVGLSLYIYTRASRPRPEGRRVWRRRALGWRSSGVEYGVGVYIQCGFECIHTSTVWVYIYFTYARESRVANRARRISRRREIYRSRDVARPRIEASSTPATRRAPAGPLGPTSRIADRDPRRAIRDARLATRATRARALEDATSTMRFRARPSRARAATRDASRARDGRRSRRAGTIALAACGRADAVTCYCNAAACTPSTLTTTTAAGGAGVHAGERDERERRPEPVVHAAGRHGDVVHARPGRHALEREHPRQSLQDVHD